MTQDTPTVEKIIRGLEQMEMQDRDGLITKDAYEYLYAELHTYGNARFEEGVQEERQAWLDVKRCELCGRAKDVSNDIWSMCKKCTEEQ